MLIQISYTIYMILCDNITYLYKKSGEGLKNLSTDMEPGHLYGLLGKNGAGKTTLLRILSGLLFSQKGSSTISGISTQARDVQVLKDFYSFPEDTYELSLSGEKFVNYYSRFYPNFDWKYFNDLAEELDILSTFKRSLNKVSLGQRKKVYVAFSLATNVKIILFDEPTNGLDIPSRTAFKSIVHQNSIKKNQLILISTHNIKDIENLVDRYIFLNEGEHLFSISVEDLFKNFSLKIHQKAESPDAISTCKVVGGYASLFEKKTQKAKEFDLETFFTIVWKEQNLIQKIKALSQRS